MTTYIHHRTGWPRFYWSHEHLAGQLATVRHDQGRLTGRMESIGVALRTEATLRTLLGDVLKSGEIDGVVVDGAQVRSCLTRRLGVEIDLPDTTDRHVDGVVEMVLDATRNFATPLTANRLFGWHATLFPAGRSGMPEMTVGGWRTDRSGPTQVIAGLEGRERVQYEPPAAERLGEETQAMLDWFNAGEVIDPVLKAGVVHLWFLAIRPFDAGNGRIARAIADMVLARSEHSAQRFTSMSAQIRRQRVGYFATLAATQIGDLDITPWLEWFLDCLGRAVDGAEGILAPVLHKARFWETYTGTRISARQRLVLDRVLDGVEGRLTTSKWAAMGKCSQDTALRDIGELVERGVLRRNPAGGRSTFYSLAEFV